MARYGNKTKSQVIDLTKILNGILDEYGEEVRADTVKVLDDMAPQIVDKVKELSPKRYGEYANGWTAERTTNSLGSISVIIYNADKPTLTHLLENGHRGYALKNGGRTRDVRGRKHIKPTEKWAEEKTIKELERKLKQ